MAARIKNLEASKEGIEFEIRTSKGVFLGDLYVTSKGLTWCEGKTAKANGVDVDWKDFIAWMTTS